MSEKDDSVDAGRRGMWGELGRAFSRGYKNGIPGIDKVVAQAMPQMDRRSFITSLVMMMGKAGLPVSMKDVILPEEMAPTEIIKQMVNDIEAVHAFTFSVAKLRGLAHGAFYTPDAAQEFAQAAHDVMGRLLRLSAYREYYEKAEAAYLEGNVFYKEEVARNLSIPEERIREWYTTIGPASDLRLAFSDAVQPEGIKAMGLYQITRLVSCQPIV